jgi:hypothetical protein
MIVATVTVDLEMEEGEWIDKNGYPTDEQVREQVRFMLMDANEKNVGNVARTGPRITLPKKYNIKDITVIMGRRN